jgi:hypothetical protein
MSGLTVREIFEQFAPDDSNVIAAGEVNGLTYRLHEAPLPHESSDRAPND